MSTRLGCINATSDFRVSKPRQRRVISFCFASSSAGREKKGACDGCVVTADEKLQEEDRAIFSHPFHLFFSEATAGGIAGLSQESPDPITTCLSITRPTRNTDVLKIQRRARAPQLCLETPKSVAIRERSSLKSVPARALNPYCRLRESSGDKTRHHVCVRDYGRGGVSKRLCQNPWRSLYFAPQSARTAVKAKLKKLRRGKRKPRVENLKTNRAAGVRGRSVNVNKNLTPAFHRGRFAQCPSKVDNRASRERGASRDERRRSERKGRVREVKSYFVVGAKGGGWKKRSRKSRGVNDFRLVKAEESEERGVAGGECRSATRRSRPFVSRIANVGDNDDSGDTGICRCHAATVTTARNSAITPRSLCRGCDALTARR
ncbi:hypothetical protein DBV15_06753 [Temnothorax longispinosus]|uniref:Uncharacterized protein n=1 Tax=Temnothorax longispinosus TaxID=300112 RepID=A0A4S2JUV3_9HYME|nr:hypothetical protein DBV15_06753 [Temnothorax longispinosus]